MVIPKGYKYTDAGIIPETWDIGSIESFGNVLSGGTPSTTVPKYWNGQIPWCTPTDITNTPTKYIVSTERCISESGLHNSSAYLMPENSLLLCTRATIGALKINTVQMATNQGFKNVFPNGINSIDFLYHLLQTKKKVMLEKAIGSTFLEISQKALCSIRLQLPPLRVKNHSKEFVAILDEYMPYWRDVRKQLNDSKLDFME